MSARHATKLMRHAVNHKLLTKIPHDTYCRNNRKVTKGRKRKQYISMPGGKMRLIIHELDFKI